MSHTSARIELNEMSLSDADEIQHILDEHEIYKNTLTIPSPLPANWAYNWIKMLNKKKEQGNLISFSIRSKSDGKIIGVASLVDISLDHERAELAYMIGSSFRRKGYATEAANMIIDYGFNNLHLSRIYAFHLGYNSSSGALLRKLGFKHEGCMINHIKKDGVFMNSEIFGILKDNK